MTTSIRTKFSENLLVGENIIVPVTVPNGDYKRGQIVENAVYGASNGTVKRTVICYREAKGTTKIVAIMMGRVNREGIENINDTKINQLSKYNLFVI